MFYARFYYVAIARKMLVISFHSTVSMLISVSGSLPTKFALQTRNALLIDRCTKICATTGVLNRNVGTKATMDQKPNWKSTILEAEKIAGFSASCRNLRSLHNKEIAKIRTLLQKIERSNHPFLKKAKLIYSGKNKMQSYWGLIVFLMSKAAGHLNVDEEKASGVLRRQMALAEVTKMIHISYLIHKSIVNVQKSDNSEFSELNDMNFGNKIALLSGDYFLANSFEILAKIRDQDLSELMSSTIRDLAEAEFIGRRDSQNNPLPSVPPVDRTNYAIKEWTLRNELSTGSLLGKSCKGALKLAKHSEEIQEQGYNFGKHLALALQASHDLNPFISEDRIIPFDLCSAPVMLHIDCDPSILTEIDKGLESVSNVDYAKLYDIVISGPGIELTKQLQREHSQRAMKVLSVFQESDARTALFDITAASEHFVMSNILH